MTQPLSSAFIGRIPIIRCNYPKQNITSLYLMAYQKSFTMTKWDLSHEGKDGFKSGNQCTTSYCRVKHHVVI